ncbi:MAG: hypothetical protein JW809_02590 [Pirellulales bacterium]|nr:hypothetical protein [Pirellulales bacterium]
MVALPCPLIVGFVVAVQVVGLLFAGALRVAEGSRFQASCHRLFLLLLALVAVAAVASFSLEPGCWLSSGATLSLMAVAGTFDSGRGREVAVW